MQLNKNNILNTIAAVIVIMAMGFFVAITSVFWISLYLVILLIVKTGRTEIPTHQRT